MTLEELLQRLLAVESPWQITKVRDDFGRGQIDVWIDRAGNRGGWLFGKRQATQEHESAWRHLNLGHARCVVHAPTSAAADERQPWAGDDGQPFTRALARQIAGLFREGIKFQSVCTMLDIAVADLWKFKHSLDHGRAGLSGAAAPLPTDSGISSVPAAEHPVWAMLLEGSLDIDIRVLGLKLFLSKLREQMRLITDDEVRLLKAHEMQRYFVRYERQLGHELAQLRRH